jgi:phosphoserine aminotransferase
VEDYLDALAWTDSVGGLNGTNARAHTNARLVYEWIEASPWAEPLAVDPRTYSHTSVCLRLPHDGTTGSAKIPNEQVMRDIVSLLAHEGVAFDIAAYRGMPAGLRIWTGATVEADDLRRLLPWLDWAYATATTQFSS